jgi:hypothetical protein
MTKTYNDVIHRLANQEFNHYMSGSWGSSNPPISLVAFIYHEDPKNVEFDINEVVKMIKESHYAKYKNK